MVFSRGYGEDKRSVSRESLKSLLLIVSLFAVVPPEMKTAELLLLSRYQGSGADRHFVPFLEINCKEDRSFEDIFTTQTDI